MTEQGASQFTCLPVLVGSKDYSGWSLAIKNQARMTNIWDVYDGSWTLPSPLPATPAPTAEATKEYNLEVKEWKRDNERAIGLLGQMVSQDLQVVLDNHVVPPATAGGPTITPTTHNLWKLLKTRFEKKDAASSAYDWFVEQRNIFYILQQVLYSLP